MNNYIGNVPAGAKNYATDTPIGSIMAWAKATPPVGWIECNGQSTAPYPDLATIVGANVPDMRGEFIRGYDNGRGVDAGRILGSTQIDGVGTGASNVALMYIIRAFDVIKDEVGAIVLPANENFIINGNMDINQRNVLSGAILSGGSFQFRADRFPCYADHQGAISFNRVSGGTNVPPINELGYQAGASSQFYIDVADTSPAGSNELDLLYYIEGFDWAKNVKGNTTTLSFWVQSNAVGSYSVGFRNSAKNRSYVTTYQIEQADVWQKVTIVLPYDPAGTWLETNQLGMTITWNFMSTPTYQTALTDQWLSGNFISATGTRNLMDTVGNYVRVSAVKMERGSRATEQMPVDVTSELVKCQRYYEEDDTATTLHPYDTATMDAICPFKVVKRVPPTMNLTRVNYTPLTTQVNTYAFRDILQSGITGVPKYFTKWTADAELV